MNDTDISRNLLEEYSTIFQKIEKDLYRLYSGIEAYAVLHGEKEDTDKKADLIGLLVHIHAFYDMYANIDRKFLNAHLKENLRAVLLPKIDSVKRKFKEYTDMSEKILKSKIISSQHIRMLRVLYDAYSRENKDLIAKMWKVSS